MRTLLLTAVAALAIGCAKDSNKSTDADKASAAKVAPTADTTATTATNQAESEAVSCDTPGEDGMDCGKQEEAGGCNKWDDEAAAVAKRDVPTGATWKTLKVAGMTCGGCERRVIAHVGKLDGVVSVEADSELGQVRIAMAGDGTETAKAALAEIKRLGYRVE